MPQSPPLRKGSLGCFGVLCVFCLLIFNAVEAGLLFHLNPDWFDRTAAWRGTRFEPEVFSANDPQSRAVLAAQDKNDWPAPQRRVLTQRTVKRFDFATTRAPYDPTTGGTINAPEGTHIELPPGAISQRCQVAITPFSELPDAMQVQFAGPVYDLRVGNNQHYNFAVPLHVTIPYIPEQYISGQTNQTPRLAVYEANGWHELPSTVDPTNHTVTADLPHASAVGVIWSAVRGAWTSLSPGAQRFIGWPASIDLVSRVLLSGTVRGWGRSVAWVGCESIDTPNFVIHYARTGDNACELNPEYDKSPDQPGIVPHYVSHIGELLEDARTKLAADGWPLPTRSAGFRYDVFLIKSDSYGESPLNGPIFLNAKLTTKAASDQVDPDRMLRHTVVHELIHVAQGEYYGIRKSMVEGTFVPAMPTMGAFINNQTWWVELSAAYSADYYWHQQGNDTDIVLDKYARGQGLLPTIPMDQAKDPDHYAYGTFLIWLDRTHNNAGHSIMWQTYQSGGITTGQATLPGIDGIARSIAGAGLGDLFVDFAKEYYVGDIWRGELVKSSHRNVPLNRALSDHFGLQAKVGDAKEFIAVSRAAGQNNGVPTYQSNDYAMASCDLMPELSAHAAEMMIEALPKDRKAKLVVRVQNPSATGVSHGAGAGDLQFLLAQGWVAGSMRSTLPLKGSSPEWASMEQGENKSTVIELWKRDLNFVAVLGVNKSLAGTAPGFLVDRWLLMAPQEIRFAREGPAAQKQWKVTWKHEDLHLHPPAFADYVVYRKRSDEPDSAYVEAGRVTDDFAILTAPSDESYAFTVATEDKVGNVSEKGRPENTDPFEGIWDGEITLVDGEIVDTMDKQFKATAEKRDKEKQAQLAKMDDADARSRASQDWEKDKKETADLWGKIKTILGNVEQLARLGMPMELELKHTGTTDADYEMRLKSFLFQPMNTAQQDGLPMTRVGERTLAVKQDVPGGQTPLPPLLFKLIRMQPESSTNTIREDAYKIPPDPSGVWKGATIKWEFTRKEGPQAAK